MASNDNTIQEAFVRVRADKAPLRKDLNEIDRMFRQRFGPKTVYRARVRAGTKEIARDMVNIRRVIDRVTGRRHSIRVAAVTTEAQRRFTRLSSTLHGLSAKPSRVRVTADTRQAHRQLAALRGEASRAVNYGFAGPRGLPAGSRTVAIPAPARSRRSSVGAGAVQALGAGTAAGGIQGSMGALLGGGFGGGFGRRFGSGLVGQLALSGGPAGSIAAGGLLGGGAGVAGAGAGAGVIGAGALAGGTTVHGLRSIDQLEQYRRVLAKVIKDQGEANQLIEEFDKLDLELPVGLEEVAGTGTRLAAAGVELEELKRAVVAVMDVSSVSLAGVKEGSGRIARILAEISSKGRILGTELRELSTLGINVEAITQAGFGLDSRTLAKRSQNFEFTSQELVSGFIKGFEDFAGGAVKARLETLSGSLDILFDQFDRMARRVAEPIFEPMIETINELAAAFERGDFKGFEQAIGAAAKKMAFLAEKAVDFASAIGAGMNGEGEGVTGAVGTALGLGQDAVGFAASGGPAGFLGRELMKGASAGHGATGVLYRARLGQEFEVSGFVKRFDEMRSRNDVSLNRFSGESDEDFAASQEKRRKKLAATLFTVQELKSGDVERTESQIKSLQRSGTNADGIARQQFGLDRTDRLATAFDSHKRAFGAIDRKRFFNSLINGIRPSGVERNLVDRFYKATGIGGGAVGQNRGNVGFAFDQTGAKKFFGGQGGLEGIAKQVFRFRGNMAADTPGLAAEQKQQRVERELLEDRQKRFDHVVQAAEQMAGGRRGVGSRIAAGRDGAAKVITDNIKAITPSMSQAVGFEGLNKLTQRSIQESRANNLRERQAEAVEGLRKDIQTKVNDLLGEIRDNTKKFHATIAP